MKSPSELKEDVSYFYRCSSECKSVSKVAAYNHVF